MDKLIRVDPERMTEQVFSTRQAMMWTALPAIIKSFDPVALTCEVQPAIKAKYVDELYNVKTVSLPLLVDCPVVFPHAGGCSMTFPIKAGDECLVVFSSRGIDLWWQQGGEQPPPEPRMHDLSDGFVILGVWSQPKRLGSVSTARVELRSDDHQAVVSIHPSTHEVTVETTGKLTAKADGNTTLTSPLVTINGDIKLNGKMTATGDVSGGGISLMSHVHGGVSSGGSTTGAPQ